MEECCSKVLPPISRVHDNWRRKLIRRQKDSVMRCITDLLDAFQASSTILFILKVQTKEIEYKTNQAFCSYHKTVCCAAQRGYWISEGETKRCSSARELPTLTCRKWIFSVRLAFFYEFSEYGRWMVVLGFGFTLILRAFLPPQHSVLLTVSPIWTTCI